MSDEEEGAARSRAAPPVRHVRMDEPCLLLGQWLQISVERAEDVQVVRITI